MSRLIVIYGATGVGKTKLSIALAGQIPAPIVSSDSRQVFREMTIGTALPSEQELAAATHYFIHDRSITNGFSAGDFEKEGLELLSGLFENHGTVLLVGGSGLYINALLYGFDDLPSDESVREQLNGLTLAQMQEKLAVLDTEYYQEVDLQNIARVRRAVEVCIVSGERYSSLRLGTVKKRNFEIIKIGLERPREELYHRINERVDIMIAQGLEAEARTLYEHRSLPALQTVGYRELFDYFDGNTTLERAIELIKQNSRHYAKRQGTWFKRDHDIKWFNADDQDGIAEYIATSNQC